jgi:hypothetical protein
VHTSRGPGITEVTIHTKRGDISITRPDGRVATMTRPGFPDREAALQRRSLEGLIAEELRRLDPDEIYGETLDALPRLADFAPHAGAGEKAVRRRSTEAPVTRTARADAGTPENVRNAPTAATPSVRGKRAPATRTVAATKAAPAKATPKKTSPKKATPKQATTQKGAAPPTAGRTPASTTRKTAAAKPGSRSGS